MQIVGCEDCGDSGRPLEPHHLFGTDIDGSDKIEVTEHLCKDCHQGRHTDLNGDYWKDVREMQGYWYSYFKEVEYG